MALSIWGAPYNDVALWDILLRMCDCDPHIKASMEPIAGRWNDVHYDDPQSVLTAPLDIVKLHDLAERPEWIVLYGVGPDYAYTYPDGSVSPILLFTGAVVVREDTTWHVFLDVTEAGGAGYRVYNDAGGTVSMPAECRLHHILHAPLLNQSGDPGSHQAWQARAIAENDFRKRHGLPLRSTINFELAGIGPASTGAKPFPECKKRRPKWHL